MRMSNLYLPTLKETPNEADIPSHQLMLRAGLIRRHSSGIYSFLPLGYKVIDKIETIIKEEMDKSGAQQVLLPIMQDAELWKESDRWDKFGPLMIKFNDRKDKEYCLGPTHEEVVAELIRDEIRSYKDLPLNLYQIQTKVRDEIRPRFGVMRGREFIMKDAYTMDRDYEGLDESYQTMYNTYSRIFDRCGLETTVVEADTGPMGGKDSHEFMVIADTGEDILALCSDCGYSANIERAVSKIEEKENKIESKNLKKRKTPDKRTIDELVDFLKIDAAKMIKSLALIADNEPVIALVRGDDELNEIKLQNYLGCNTLEEAEDKDFELFNSVPGFTGPIGLDGVKIIADKRIQYVKNGVSGANEEDYHYLNVNPGRDFEVDDYVDLRKVKAGEKCIKCGSELKLKNGIEIGHIFKLGTKYSESLNATYLDKNGKEQDIVMGSYGIGVTRLIAAAIEQSHDEYGIIWPTPIAPYQVIILQLGQSEEVINASENIYNKLSEQDVEVLLDDRDERPGVKFNDADLVGIPLRVTVGSRSLENNEVEIKIRDTEEEFNISVDQAKDQIINNLQKI